MLRALFSGVSGLKTHQTKMDVIGNNIANVNTYGFKASRVAFKDVFYQTINGASNASAIMGGSNPSQIGYGSMVSSIDVLHTRSGFSPTGLATDAFIEGEGYFVTQDGSGSVKYTRVGMFGMDGEGNWVDANSNFLCGYATKFNATTGEMEIDKTQIVPIKNPGALSDADGDGKYDTEDKANPIQLNGVTIGKDGVITGQDENGKVITIGQICLANIPNPQALVEFGNSYLVATNNTGDIQIREPGDGIVGALKAGGLEMSNVDLSTEFAEMIITQRGFQANSRVITVGDEMLQELVNLKR